MIEKIQTSMTTSLEEIRKDVSDQNFEIKRL